MKVSNPCLKRFFFVLATYIVAFGCMGQRGERIEQIALHFSLEQENDTIDFIVVDTLLDKKKPVFLWCQGSLPVPLICEIEGYGNYFFGGGASNFDISEIRKDYHLVVISMPKTPVIAKKENLNSSFQFIPNPEKPKEFSNEYLRADYLDNYVSRAQSVLRFLKEQEWVDNDRLIVAGHSQGTKVATKISVLNNEVTHLGMFAANPMGRIDQFIREARFNAHNGKISWAQADTIINDTYELYSIAHHPDSLKARPDYNALKTFSETFYDDWLTLNIPIYLAYGTEDRTADLCDIIPLFFIEQGKTNLTLKRYIGLDHNFFEMHSDGRPHYEKGHWKDVMSAFLQWIK